MLPNAGSRAHRPRSPITGAKDIGANDKMILRPDTPTLPNHTRPPSLGIGVRGKRMTYPYHIAPVGIQPPVGMIGYRQLWEGSTRFQHKRLFRRIIIHGPISNSMQNKGINRYRKCPFQKNRAFPVNFQCLQAFGPNTVGPSPAGFDILARGLTTSGGLGLNLQK